MLLCIFIGTNDFDVTNNLEKGAYTYVAEKYNKSVHNVKNNIINSTKLIYDSNRTPKNIINEVLININNKSKYA